MNKKYLLLICLLTLLLSYNQLNGQTKKRSTKATKYKLKPVLRRRFGTIVNLQVEIIDGDSLRMKETQSKFYVKIKKIENKTLSDSIVLSFDDRSGYFPEDLVNLYWHVYNHQPNYGITSDTAVTLRKNYVGKVFDVAAYESGFFWGMPDNYTKYVGIRQEPSFHFRSVLIIVSDTHRPRLDD